MFPFLTHLHKLVIFLWIKVLLQILLREAHILITSDLLDLLNLLHNLSLLQVLEPFQLFLLLLFLLLINKFLHIENYIYLSKVFQLLFQHVIYKHDLLFSHTVTEREVRHGIIDAKNTKDHCLAYIRDIDNMNLTALRFARNFIDMTGREVDKEAVKLLSVLRDEILPTKLPDYNIARFKIEWTGKEGLDRESHKEYLRDFCEHFYASVTDQVERAVEQSRKLSNDAVYGEVLQHLHSCANMCKSFQGREEVVEKISEYILGDSHEPLVLFGESGCGNTSLLAKGYSQVSV